jgi:predicted DNA-binding transcriptional regulator YafY
VDTAGRLLELLALFGARSWWSGDELARRLEVTARTLRRDVTRLRMLGYPIEATTGPNGGYRLGAGGRLPPLVLDDDEAVAVAVALRQAAGSAGSGMETAALTALTKLDQVLPVQLRERVVAVRTVTVDLRTPRLPPADVDALIVVALACRRPERLRFTYEDGDGRITRRLVEPFRLVTTGRRWYLVAYDTDREAWRTFRVDRLSELRLTGTPFEHRDPPDAGTLVSEGLALRAHAYQARVVLHLPFDVASRIISPTVGVLERIDDGHTLARIGGEPDWIARYLAGLDCRYEVLEPPEVHAELLALGERLVKEHADVDRADRGERH